MDILFQPSHGTHFYFEIGFFDTVLEIKEKIQKYKGIPVSNQTLIFNGNTLPDDLNVHYSEILDRSLINVLLSPATDPPPPSSTMQPPPPTELQDFKTLKECELSDNSEINVAVRSSSVRVFVLTKRGAEKVPVEVSPSDNVGGLREKMEKMKLDLPREGYFFIYKQNVMVDDRSFRWHHVCQGDTIEIFSGSVSGGS